MGAELKSTFALGFERHAILSHHLGDLDHLRAFDAYRASIDHYQRLYSVRPERLIRDLHPDLASSRLALDRAQRGDLAELSVQHHHAHMASCMAENGLEGTALGVIFDGAGLGTDGTLWGGEILLGTYAEVRRFAHLEPVPLPGGDQASREPWRMALAHLRAAGRSPDCVCGRVDATARRVVERMIETRLNSPMTSSMGRLFDAVAAILRSAKPPGV